MTALVAYCDVNSTAGGNGTTPALTGVNRAYASHAEMEAAENKDFVAAGDSFTGIFAGGVDITPAIWSGGNSSALFDILLTTTVDRHNGAFDVIKYNMNNGVGSSAALTIIEEFVSVIGFQFERESLVSSSSNRWSCGVDTGVSAGVFVLDQNIFKSSAFDITGDVSGFRLADSSITYKITNNIFYDFDGTDDFGITTNAGSPSGYYICNTFINCTTGIRANSNMPATNNIFQDCGVDIMDTPNASSDFNLTDKVSIIGSNSVTSSTLVFNDKAGGDFSLVVGDTDAIGAGVGPSTNSDVPLVDIIGTARSGTTTDIGAFMFVGGGSGVTVTADTGTYLYTGTDASLLVSRIMQASSGSYAYTGTSINILKGFMLDAVTGSYVLTGSNVNLIYTPVGANILIADTGSYVLTGADINFNRDRVMIALSGSYLYQGTDIQITLPGQIWTDKPSVATNWNNQTNVTTIWTDK